MATATATAPAVRHIDAFESRQCSRCGGGGTHSWTRTWGNTCFKCGTTPNVPGSGFCLTKLGAAALDAWRTANMDLIPAGDLAPGDLIDVYRDGRRRRVLTIDRGGNYGSCTSTVGGVTTKTDWDIRLHTSDGYTRPMSSGTVVSRWMARRFLLPPVMDPGTKRTAEMRAYIAAAAADRGA